MAWQAQRRPGEHLRRQPPQLRREVDGEDAVAPLRPEGLHAEAVHHPGGAVGREMLPLARAERRHGFELVEIDRPHAVLQRARPAPRRRSSAPRDIAPAAARRSRRSRCAAAPRRARPAAAGDDSRSAPPRSPCAKTTIRFQRSSRCVSRSISISKAIGSMGLAPRAAAASPGPPITAMRLRAAWPPESSRSWAMAAPRNSLRPRRACLQRFQPPCATLRKRLAMKELVEILWRSLIHSVLS